MGGENALLPTPGSAWFGSFNIAWESQVQSPVVHRIAQHQKEPFEFRHYSEVQVTRLKSTCATSFLQDISMETKNLRALC